MRLDISLSIKRESILFSLVTRSNIKVFLLLERCRRLSQTNACMPELLISYYLTLLIRPILAFGADDQFKVSQSVVEPL
jgi:hypothetical protein